MSDLNFVTIGFKLGMFFVPFLFALCFHEYAHAQVAKWFGDTTAERLGRLSLNPMVHADMLGTFVLPISALVFGSPFFFGWAKPVPVNTRNLNRPGKDMFWVALAGPASNVLLALISSIVLGLGVGFGMITMGGAAIELLRTFIMINMFLAIFNLIPIHPLDGGKVIEPFLPRQWNMWLEQNQSMLSIALLVGILMLGNVLSIPVTIAVRQLLNVSMIIAQLVA